MATNDVVVIEDEDGFRSEHPWPTGKLMIANTEFLGLCEQEHDRQRERWEGTHS